MLIRNTARDRETCNEMSAGRMKKIVSFLAISLIITGIILSGCMMYNFGSFERISNLEDKTWVLESYGEQDNLQAVLEGTQITATFDSAEGRVNGSAGCNTYSGDSHISKNNLSIPLITSTEMYCLEPEGVMEQEQQYLTALRGAESFEIKDGKLYITSGTEILLFNAKE